MPTLRATVRLAALPAFLALAFSANSLAQDLVFTLKNHSSYAVMEFYASPHDVDDWEEDILGEDVLPSRSEIEITIADARTQCAYDLRFVFEDGDVVERGGVDLCRTGSYTLTD